MSYYFYTTSEIRLNKVTLFLNIADYQFQTAAQVVDQRTAVGLARTQQVDLRFFLPPPPLPDLEHVCILEEI